MAQAKKIESKIVRVGLAQPAKADMAVAAKPDIDPRYVPIHRRPEGLVPADAVKIKYATTEGKGTFYFTISWIQVTGVVGGKEVAIWRPLEVFFHTVQPRDDSQWITALMRTLSQNARAGMMAEVLKDLCDTEWSRGPVTLLWTPTAKGKIHGSETAAFAYIVLEVLRLKGYLDQYHRVLPVAEMVEAQKNFGGMVFDHSGSEGTEPLKPVASAPKGSHVVGTCRKDRCGGDIVLMDGCQTCLACGDSKCS